LNNLRETLKDNNVNYRLLLWVFLLTALSGAMNVYTILNLGTPASHHTGNASAISVSLYNSSVPSKSLLFLLFSFFSGSFLSGILYHDKNMKPRKRYGISLFFGGAVLILLEFLRAGEYKIYFISFWMGMQNGMFLTYKGALIRTSHITGYLTDAGFTLGSIIREKRKGLWRVSFYLISIFSFIIGGIGGNFLVDKVRFPLSVIGMIYISSGFYFFHIRKKAMERREAKDKVTESENSGKRLPVPGKTTEKEALYRPA